MRKGAQLIRLSLTVLPLLLAGALSAVAQCEYKTFPHTRTEKLLGTQGHSSGKHRARVTAKIQCQCEHSCRSNCSIAWDSPPICEDRGRLQGPYVHRTSSAEKLRSGTKANGREGGASCGAAFGCFIEKCIPGFCEGIAIAVKGQPLGVGAGVTFTGNPQEFWKAEIEVPFECEACWTSREVTDELMRIGQEYRDPDDGGYGSGSGWVYKTCWWSCQSWTGSDGVFYEECSLVECVVL